MLTIRFHRTGRTNYPSFKIVVTDKTKSSTGGRFIEEVGFFNPATKEKVLKPERLKYWISVGAKPSPTVWNLLVQEKVVEGTKLPKHKKPKKKEETAPVAAAPAKQTPEAVVPAAEQPAPVPEPKPEAPKAELIEPERPAPEQPKS
ncbi:MAG: 30S ribosomal protein S16 [Candidatus Wildermuthbacteria bacterium]|nr:30S ribosomal protein S16 [Candidatus Wildermuthbacteria bacterium]